MTREEFNSKYDTDRRCIVTYRAANGDRLKGLALDGVQTSVTGSEFVYVDAFTNPVLLACIEDVQTTTEW